MTTTMACDWRDLPSGLRWCFTHKHGEQFHRIVGELVTEPQPRVLARITEEDAWTYGYRCEACDCSGAELALLTAVDIARMHAVRTGHAVLVEAL